MNSNQPPPEKQSFEYVGFFEEVWDVRLNKILGLRRCSEQPDRKFGIYGAKEELATSDIHLDNGHKKSVVKASLLRPLRIRTIYSPICGRELPRDNKA